MLQHHCRATSFPESLFFPSPGARGDRKKRDPGNEVALPWILETANQYCGKLKLIDVVVKLRQHFLKVNIYLIG